MQYNNFPRSLQSGPLFLIRYGILLHFASFFRWVFFFVFFHVHVHFGCSVRFSCRLVSLFVSRSVFFLSFIHFSVVHVHVSNFLHIWGLDWMSFVLPKKKLFTTNYFAYVIFQQNEHSNRRYLCILMISNTHTYDFRSFDLHTAEIRWISQTDCERGRVVIPLMRLCCCSTSFRNFSLQLDCFILFVDKCNPSGIFVRWSILGEFINKLLNYSATEKMRKRHIDTNATRNVTENSNK